MTAIKYIAVLGLATSALAGLDKRAAALDNSAAVLKALQKENADIVVAGNAAAAYNPKDPKTALALFTTIAAQVTDGMYADFIVNTSPSQYSEAGAQSINDFVSNTLEPSTLRETQQYAAQKQNLKDGGILDFVIAGLTVGKSTIITLAGDIEKRMPADKLAASQAGWDKLEQDVANLQAYLAS